MRFIVGVLSFAVLSGCATVSDLTAGKPAHTYLSTKLPEAVATCVFPAWQRYREGSTLSHTSHDWKIVSKSFWQVDDVVRFELSDQGTGSIIKHYQRSSTSEPDRDGIRIAMNQCL